jgi:hypothetical protein
LEHVLEDLAHALEHAESMMEHHRHHLKDSAFANGLQQLAEVSADQAPDSSPGSGSPNGTSGTSPGGSGQSGTTPANNGVSSSPSKGKFATGWHHFGEWWHKKHHHHHHHDHPFNPSLKHLSHFTAKAGSSTTAYKKSSNGTTQSSGHGQQGAGNPGNTSHTDVGHSTTGQTKKSSKGTTGHGSGGFANHFGAAHHIGGTVGHRTPMAHHATTKR